MEERKAEPDRLLSAPNEGGDKEGGVGVTRQPGVERRNQGGGRERGEMKESVAS